MKMKKNHTRIWAGMLALLTAAVICLSACGQTQVSAAAEKQAADGVEKAAENADAASKKEPTSGKADAVSKDGEYTSKEEVAAYIHQFGRLPDNYITKKEAEELGWDNRQGNLWEVAPGKSIGGSRFGNYEGNLPEAKGRKYFECDIDFDGGYRNAKRIIFSNDGLIFYTEDHYETFEQLY